MIVRQSQTSKVIAFLQGIPCVSLDTETTGLRPYQGDRPFSLILGNSKRSFYFNFKKYVGIHADLVHGPATIKLLQPLFNNAKKEWAITGAKFDMAMLHHFGLEIAGTIWCTVTQGRVVENDGLSNSLDAWLNKLGRSKNDTVSDYIDEHKLFVIKSVPGKKNKVKFKFYDKVPFEIITKYGLDDATDTGTVADYQKLKLKFLAKKMPPSLPSITRISDNEARLIKTVYRMEKVGVKINEQFCKDAIVSEQSLVDKATCQFEILTKIPFKDSRILFEKVLIGQRSKWKFTKKGNPSFKSDVLKKMSGEVAKLILLYRDSKAKKNFYESFLYFADDNGIIHAHFNQHIPVTGRFSSSEPNLQNLKKDEEDDLKQEFVVRRAIVPRPGNIFMMFDYDQMEYKLMLDYAAYMAGHITPLVERVLDGQDVHQATSDLVKEKTGFIISRYDAKQGNFATLYGAGIPTLAATLKVDLKTANMVRESIFRVAPEIKTFIDVVMVRSESRRFIFNWAGRILKCANPRLSYRMPNHLIQGGCADINKYALNEIDEFILKKPVDLVMTIHDEAVLEGKEDRLFGMAPAIKKMMEDVYKPKYLPMTVSVEYSRVSLADKEKWTG